MTLGGEGEVFVWGLFWVGETETRERILVYKKIKNYQV